ncbi:hypothetical protein TTHERM_000191328 (macronuclear) [Tetrahymena thermophila SB210]|uniref:Uncharacterized protein n=1 Tax=Tetrahymena thermophila (strain SB210) TaxID=312017 RepID=W7XJL6_TETTS|nr:hypothetical protein TTHERM_000191328 [Tetrahymena thermophila SB210]EWS74254.1 hypothetical protein TTHERM_000191328 [Tetrahymena thermophila SB210]|eukprot:XP_012653227.1 hypothetical protein TTHERM_000191328 [Tetrahymena thermophila SB210]
MFMIKFHLKQIYIFQITLLFYSIKYIIGIKSNDIQSIASSIKQLLQNNQLLSSKNKKSLLAFQFDYYYQVMFLLLTELFYQFSDIESSFVCFESCIIGIILQYLFNYKQQSLKNQGNVSESCSRSPIHYMFQTCYQVIILISGIKRETNTALPIDVAAITFYKDFIYFALKISSQHQKQSSDKPFRLKNSIQYFLQKICVQKIFISNLIISEFTKIKKKLNLSKTNY